MRAYPSPRYAHLVGEFFTVFHELQSEFAGEKANVNDDTLVILAALIVVSDNILEAT